MRGMFCATRLIVQLHPLSVRLRSVVKEAATALTLDDVEGESGK
jgi:hypothetical protein